VFGPILNSLAYIKEKLLMSLAANLIEYSSTGMYASVVCIDESIYEGSIVNEGTNGLWFSVGSNPDRVILFPWTSINRVVLKKIAEQ
jgi:hypothetical protein